MVGEAIMTSWLIRLFVCILGWKACHGLGYYDYYVPDGTIKAGLVAEGDTFTLNEKDLTIFSGSFHYFRVHPDYWRDTLKKYRAAGLNTVQAYVPWNLHEPRRGVFDFADLDEDLSPFLDLRAFLQMAQEEDLFVLLRPGPYICAEWDFGGLPSWLLRDEHMRMRINYEGFINPVRDYFNNLLPRVADLQFTRGGPIIGVQIENEYGNNIEAGEPEGLAYKEFLKETLTANGLDESLYYTSDGILWYGDRGAVEGALMTANFNENAEENLDKLKLLQPDRPLMTAEYWTGWFDYWLADSHYVMDPEKFGSILEVILKRNSSVNLYMFIGGTNFAFMPGASMEDWWPFFSPYTTSYDYDAPLSEAGDYTEKYTVAKDIIAKYNPLEGVVDHPEKPPQREKIAYDNVAITEHLDFPTLLAQQTSVEVTDGPCSMEQLPINDNNGQSHGYISYTTNAYLTPTSKLLITNHVRDLAQVLVDGVVMTKPYSTGDDVSRFGFWNGKDQELDIPGSDKVAEVTIMVENFARSNFIGPDYFSGKKGIWEGSVFIDGIQIDEWVIHALEMKGKQVENYTGWQPFQGPLETPAMYRGVFEITEAPKDTFLDMSGWNKGVVFINGFNVGKYWKEGPTRTLYVPGPLLRIGQNKITAFEQYTPSSEFIFTAAPILG
ncbi:beta-galactosidase-1-like protein 2 [Macrobrachium rosenbergii]|uniref:beta-galactosidase-1-like protein 2 n=1 Tax=Macrobrachium rosenbergii TaxID=79674 RepID=UPI0034D62CD5